MGRRFQCNHSCSTSIGGARTAPTRETRIAFDGSMYCTCSGLLVRALLRPIIVQSDDGVMTPPIPHPPHANLLPPVLWPSSCLRTRWINEMSSQGVSRTGDCAGQKDSGEYSACNYSAAGYEAQEKPCNLCLSKTTILKIQPCISDVG